MTSWPLRRNLYLKDCLELCCIVSLSASLHAEVFDVRVNCSFAYNSEHLRRLTVENCRVVSHGRFGETEYTEHLAENSRPHVPPGIDRRA